jgi:hypothetical protein
MFSSTHFDTYTFSYAQCWIFVPRIVRLVVSSGGTLASRDVDIFRNKLLLSFILFYLTMLFVFLSNNLPYWVVKLHSV